MRAIVIFAALVQKRPVTYAFGELDQIVLAYATTIHKSRGSEYPLHPAVHLVVRFLTNCNDQPTTRFAVART
jgi:hypothetical protein